MLRILVIALLALLVSPAALAAEPKPAAVEKPGLFEQGKAAYDRKDWKTAIINLRPLAEAGDDRAMLLLGNMYNEGYGVLPNPAEAMKLYKTAAIAKNNASAMVAVGAMYIDARGVDSNYNAALQWMKRAAQLGDQNGAIFTALILMRGNRSAQDKIMPDTKEAYKWFRIAQGEKGSPKLQSAAKKGADGLAAKRLSKEDVAAADKEAAAFRPADIKSLGPPPADPAPVKPVQPKAPYRPMFRRDPAAK